MFTRSNLLTSLRPSVPILFATKISLPNYLLLVFLFCVVAGVLKGVYNRYLHPLRNFPGPFWGGFTDFYKLYIFASKHIPSATMELHQKYGLLANVKCGIRPAN